MTIFHCAKCGRGRFAPPKTSTAGAHLNCASCDEIRWHHGEELRLVQDTGRAVEHWRV